MAVETVALIFADTSKVGRRPGSRQAPKGRTADGLGRVSSFYLQGTHTRYNQTRAPSPAPVARSARATGLSCVDC